MKVTKIVKYNYRLTEESLEKDIDKFIYDLRMIGLNINGLRIIKQYFKLIGEKFVRDEFEECARCYKKLILFLFDNSTGMSEVDFGYEDLLAKVSDDFDNFVEKYFISLVKVYSNEELANECYDYIIKLGEYGFNSEGDVLIRYLERKKLDDLIGLLLLKTEGMDKGDEEKQDVIYFLIGLFEEMGEEEKRLKLCERFKWILPEEEIDYLKRNNKISLKELCEKDDLWENKTKINGVWVDDETGEVLRE